MTEISSYSYLGKFLIQYSLEELVFISHSLTAAEVRRQAASQHDKFKTMEFPPANPEFLKLKEAINNEIESRKNGIIITK